MRLILEFDYLVCESYSESYSIYQIIILGYLDNAGAFL